VNGRLQTLLVALVVCLIGVPMMGRQQSASASAHVENGGKLDRKDLAAPAVPTAAVSRLMNATAAHASGISTEVLSLALRAVSCAVSSGIGMPRTLTVIDYSLPSIAERLWVFEVATGNLLFRELVAHGRNTGENMATSFSDRLNSRQSSIGLFVTGDTYVGSNGYSLRLDGLEPGFNGHARERAIVMHGAPYVDVSLAKSQGRIGRSWGCPALREGIARQVIDTIRGGGMIFSYYPDDDWLRSSRFLNCGSPSVVATS
jgi:hypothetical protein